MGARAVVNLSRDHFLSRSVVWQLRRQEFISRGVSFDQLQIGMVVVMPTSRSARLVVPA
jgi:hypothetical protein